MLSQCASRCSTLTVRISIFVATPERWHPVVEVGQRVKVLPSGVESNVARIVTFDGDREEAFAGEAITLVLTDEIDISRGDLLLAADEALPLCRARRWMWYGWRNSRFPGPELRHQNCR